MICECAKCYEEAYRVVSEFDRERYLTGYADQLNYFGKLRAKDWCEETEFQLSDEYIVFGEVWITGVL